MAAFDLGDGLRTVLLAGVGAIATGAEKSQQIIEELVKKGELTVEQGKSLNEELTRKATKAASETQDTFLRTFLERMSAEERAEYARKVADMSSEIDARTTTVEIEVEEATDEAEAEEPEANENDEA